MRKAIEADPAELIDAADAQVFRVRRSGVVFKMKARPELLVDYLLQATEAMAPSQAPAAPAQPVDTPSEAPLPPNTGPFLIVRQNRSVVFASPAARTLLTLPEDLSQARFEEPIDVDRVVERTIKSGRRSLDVLIRARAMVFNGEDALGISLRDVTELERVIFVMKKVLSWLIPF